MEHRVSYTSQHLKWDTQISEPGNPELKSIKFCYSRKWIGFLCWTQSEIRGGGTTRQRWDFAWIPGGSACRLLCKWRNLCFSQKRKVLGECSFAFNYLRRSCPGEAEVLVKLELNAWYSHNEKDFLMFYLQVRNYAILYLFSQKAEELFCKLLRIIGVLSLSLSLTNLG